MPTRKAYAASEEPTSKRLKREKPETEDDEDDNNVVEMSQNPGFTSTDNSPEVGIIERVVMKNFLCHTVQDISFGPRVNFLIGNNGSGKSAVMTAIVVGLGGKASATSRGSNIKNFVKWGKSTAEISIHLRNQGHDAYKPDIYGKTIIVRRKLHKEGIHGPYQLRNASGQIVSQKKEELTHILDEFNIQVDNPVSLLNQDTCKHFLHSKSGHDKYMFFMRATQLEQMKQDYVDANQFKDRAKETLKIKLQELPELEREVKQWEEKHKAFDAIEDLRTKVQKLKDEMAWAIVTVKETVLEPVRMNARKEEARTPKFVGKVQDKEKEVSECIAKEKEIKDRMKQMSTDADELTPHYNDLKAAKDDKKKYVKLKQAEVTSLEKELRRAKKDRESTEDRIKEIQTSIQKDFDANKRAREERIGQLEAQHAQITAQLKTTSHVLVQIKAAVDKCKADMARIRNDERDLNGQKDQYTQAIKELQSTRSNKLRRFGQQMPELIRQIDEAANRGMFNQKPKGPIGARINLRDPKWAIAVEVCLAGHVNAFCVHDHHDEKQLENIMKQVLGNANKPVIITSRFTERIHDVRPYKAVSHYPTVLDMIDLKNADPVIINTLIDQKSIENILLIETPAETRQVMSRNPPQKVKTAFTMEGDHAFCAPTFRYYSLPSEKTSSVLTSNLEESINQLKKKHGEIERLWREKQHDLKEKDREVKENQKQERIHHGEKTKLQDQSSRCTFEISELKAASEDEAAPDVTALEEDVERYDEQITAITTRLNVQQSKLDAVKDEYANAEAAFKEVDEKMRTITNDIDPIQEEHSSVIDALEVAKKHRKYYVDKLKEHEKILSDLKKELAMKEKDVTDSIAKAEAYCERKRTRRTPESIESEISQIEKRINTEEKNRGNRAEIVKMYTETYESFAKIKRDVMLTKKLLEHLDEVMAIREQNFFHFRKIIALRAKYSFITTLNLRKFTGRLSFDHKAECLALSVQPSKESRTDVAKDVRSLSGGERSFSTVCFILSLWDAIESPFRMLDEFDVFMDMVNRRISMEMLIEATTVEGNKRRQFIFLTPQDMSRVPSDNVRIFRMRAPERGQTTLNFEAGDSSRTESSQVSDAGAATNEEDENGMGDSRKRK